MGAFCPSVMHATRLSLVCFLHCFYDILPTYSKNDNRYLIFFFERESSIRPHTHSQIERKNNNRRQEDCPHTFSAVLLSSTIDRPWDREDYFTSLQNCPTRRCRSVGGSMAGVLFRTRDFSQQSARSSMGMRPTVCVSRPLHSSPPALLLTPEVR